MDGAWQFLKLSCQLLGSGPPILGTLGEFGEFPLNREPRIVAQRHYGVLRTAARERPGACRRLVVNYEYWLLPAQLQIQIQIQRRMPVQLRVYLLDRPSPCSVVSL